MVCRLYFGPSAACAGGLHLLGEDGSGGGEYGGSAVGADVGGGRIVAGAIDDGGGVREGEGAYDVVESGGDGSAGEFTGAVEACGECVGEVALVLGGEYVSEGTEVGVVGQGDTVGIAAEEAVGHAKLVECSVFCGGDTGAECGGQLRIGIVLVNEFTGVIFAGNHHQGEQYQTEKVQFFHNTKFGCKGTLNSRKICISN